MNRLRRQVCARGCAPRVEGVAHVTGVNAVLAAARTKRRNSCYRCGRHSLQRAQHYVHRRGVVGCQNVRHPIPVQIRHCNATYVVTGNSRVHVDRSSEGAIPVSIRDGECARCLARRCPIASQYNVQLAIPVQVSQCNGTDAGAVRGIWDVRRCILKGAIALAQKYALCAGVPRAHDQVWIAVPVQVSYGNAISSGGAVACWARKGSVSVVQTDARTRGVVVGDNHVQLAVRTGVHQFNGFQCVKWLRAESRRILRGHIGGRGCRLQATIAVPEHHTKRTLVRVVAGGQGGIPKLRERDRNIGLAIAVHISNGNSGNRAHGQRCAAVITKVRKTVSKLPTQAAVAVATVQKHIKLVRLIVRDHNIRIAVPVQVTNRNGTGVVSIGIEVISSHILIGAIALTQQDTYKIIATINIRPLAPD